MVTIYGNPPPVYGTKPGKTQPGRSAVNASQESGEIIPERVSDRRSKPDRRQKDLPWDQPERRRRSRRSPQLLNARNGKPENLTPTKGRLIDTAV